MVDSSREMDLNMPVTARGFYSILDFACRNKGRWVAAYRSESFCPWYWQSDSRVFFDQREGSAGSDSEIVLLCNLPFPPLLVFSPTTRFVI